MQKNKIKIIIYAIAIIVTTLLLNNFNVNAVEVRVKLEVGGSTGQCHYGGSVNFGFTGASFSARSLESDFYISGDNMITTRYCDDYGGVEPRELIIKSSDILNMTYNTTGNTISSGDVEFKINSAYVPVGSGICTATGGTAGNYELLSGYIKVMGKQSETGQVCSIYATGAMLKVNLKGGQSAGHYSGILYIGLPNL